MIGRHPWEVARLHFFRHQLVAHGLDRRSIDVIDVGSGDAWPAMALLPCLHEASHITCFDPGYDQDWLQDLRRRGGPRMHFTATAPRDRFHLALILDVLEHVEDDEAFLEDLVRENLRSGGHVLVSVPAWRGLYGGHDASLGHFRRYQPKEAVRLLEQSGLATLSCGGLFHSLLVPRFIRKLMAPLGMISSTPPHAGEWRAGPALTAIVEGALTLDCSLSSMLAKSHLSLPGLSWWALCSKRH